MTFSFNVMLSEATLALARSASEHLLFVVTTSVVSWPKTYFA